MGRHALLIASSQYEDERFSGLKGATADVEELFKVLVAPDIGSFSALPPLIDRPSYSLTREIEQFFEGRWLDDTLLLYFSGHGMLDDHGRLHLVATDTDPRRLRSTAISAAFIRDVMDSCRSQRQLLILDCCHGGAFGNTKTGVGTAMRTDAAFGGTGRVVMTASDATQFAFEGNAIRGEMKNSLFTHFLLEGLRTGAADADGNGEITVDELYQYAYEQVTKQSAAQDPSKWVFGQKGDILIAKNPRPSPRRDLLPKEVLETIESGSQFKRRIAVEELARLATGNHPGIRLAAKAELRALCSHDSRSLSNLAQAKLNELEPGKARAAEAKGVSSARPPAADKPQATPSAPTERPVTATPVPPRAPPVSTPRAAPDEPPVAQKPAAPGVSRAPVARFLASGPGKIAVLTLGMLLMVGVLLSLRETPEPILPFGEDNATAADHTESPVPVSESDPSWGQRNAPVTIVEFTDFQCPFCSRVVPTLKKIEETYGPEKVRIVFKHQPLPFHKDARPAHDAAATVFALGGSDAFWRFHDLAFENQKELTEENFETWAGVAGVDVARFKEAFDTKKYAPKVDEDMALAKKVGARGTPAFRINGITLSGAQPFERFKDVIDAQIAEADKLVEEGMEPEAVYVALSKKNFEAPAPKEDSSQGAAEEDETIWKVPVFYDDPVKGPADALVTIVEWSDFQCPFCKRVEPTITKIREEYENDVRVVWKDNTLPFHKRARPAAILAREAYRARGDKGFWAAHGILFENQTNLEDDGLRKYAGELDLSWPAVKAAIDANKYDAKISSSIELAMDLNARGTPHFFINGRRLSGAQPYEKFKAVIDEQLAVAKTLVSKGVSRAKVYDAIMEDAKGPPPPERKDVPAPTEDNPSKGNQYAKVVIQEFSDFQCPFCGRVNPTLKRILDEYGNQVRIVWRNLPLDFHQDAPLAAEAAYEAFVQQGDKGFWRFHDELFANQKALKREHLEGYAQKLGLDMALFRAALDTREHKPMVEKDKAIAQKAGIRGTPGFTVNGYFISGAQPFPAFEKMIQLALKE